MEMMSLPRVYMFLNNDPKKNPTNTLGSIYRENGDIVCKTMELPWLGNKNNISCIPEGIHRVVFEADSPLHHYPHYRLPDVAGRRGILIHKITYVKDLRGCIGVGSRFADLNNDGILDISASGIKLEWMVNNLPKEFLLNIYKK